MRKIWYRAYLNLSVKNAGNGKERQRRGAVQEALCEHVKAGG